MPGRSGSDPSNTTRYLTWGEDTREERYSRAKRLHDKAHGWCAKGHGVMGRWKTTQESPWMGVQKVTRLSGDKTTQGGPSQLTTLFRFRPREFGSRPMAQSRQSTSGITVVVGFLPGTAVTT